MPQQSLALFPLHTVLVPGAALALRVFEPRYLDLVRDCGRSGDGFGVCLILEGSETGTPALPAAFGTEARIEDFGSGSDSLLTLRVRGARRFHVRRTRVRDNGLVVAEVDWCDADPDDSLRPEHGLLAILLQGLLDQSLPRTRSGVGGRHARPSPALLDDAAWVGWRLAELLPLTDAQRQSLLQADDPHARLDRLLAWIS
ncbi:MAG: LON peptidase substrate-binding domain-containing protein [Gammaproteobacteria bacterium]|nr:LON peptidase substrate-binding domain-containing protein [Gammaproteobacteria bacterium]